MIFINRNYFPIPINILLGAVFTRQPFLSILYYGRAINNRVEQFLLGYQNKAMKEIQPAGDRCKGAFLNILLNIILIIGKKSICVWLQIK